MQRLRRVNGVRSAVAIVVIAFSACAIVEAGEVRFTVVEPSNTSRPGWPVTSGVPLKRRALFDADKTSLHTANGQAVPLQTEVLSRWSDGSVRWLLLDFQTELGAGETKPFVLRYGPDARHSESAVPLKVTETDDQVEINTGPLRIVIDEKSFRLLDAVWLDRDRDGVFGEDERLTSSNGTGIVLTAPDGTRFHADLTHAETIVEQSCPLRACIRITGRHSAADGSMFRYIVRLHAFRGQPYVKLCYSFVNDNPNQLMSEVDSLDLVFAKTDSGTTSSVLDGRLSSPARLFQVDDRKYEIDGRPAGRRALGWAAIADERGGLAVGVRDFWQNWPKSLETRSDQLRVGICPQFATGLYDGKSIKEEAQLYYYLRDGKYSFKIGVSRTHEMWATFFKGPANIGRLSEFYRAIEQPLLAQPSPEYVSSTRAAGRIAPAKKSSGYARYDAWLDGLFKLHLTDVDDVREYGMLNFGDWYNIKWDSWGNLEYDTARCFFTQYLRTGDRRYFDRASQAARHYMDVDVVHAVNEQLHAFAGSAKMKPGHVWLHQVGHTGGYYGRYDGEKYHDEAPLIMKGAYQLGMYNWGHQWIGGVFDHYLLTGDRGALEVATMTADAIAGDCPTRYSDHIRDLGWPLNLVVAAYEATGEQKYLDAATRQWKLLQQHYDPDKGFHVMLAYGHCSAPSTADRCHGQCGYMLGLTLSGLARYHRITKDPEALLGLTAGVEQLVRECWSEEHKTFYFTSCTHTRGNPPPALCSVTALASEAFAYESEITGNAEHGRIFREAFNTMVNAGLESVARGDQQGQTGYSSMMFHFTPHALWALD